MIVYAVLAVAAIGGFIAMLRLESRNRGDVVVFTILGLLILESAIFPHQGDVPPGPFHPTFGGFDLRLVDVLIPAALMARLLVRGLPIRVTGLGLAWFSFFAWYGFGFFIGLASGGSFALAVFQAKCIVHTGGMAVLMAGVPTNRLTAEQPMRSFVVASAVLVAITSVFNTLGIHAGVPLIKGSQLGTVGPDFATVAFTIGVLCLMVELARHHRHTPTIVACVVVLFGPIFARQRAAIIGAALGLVIMGLVMAGRKWRALSPVRFSQAVLVLIALLLPAGLLSIRNASSQHVQVPLAGSLQATFGSTAKVESADARKVLWKEGKRLFAQRPLLGWGLGRDFALFESNGTEEPLTGGDFHNVIVDVAVRNGLPGILFLSVACGTTALAVWATWRRARDLVGALTVGCGIVLAGLATKSLFESTLQKFRLATMIGMVIGIVVAARRTVPDRFTEVSESTWS